MTVSQGCIKGVSAETDWFLWINSGAETVQNLPDFHIDPTQRAEHLLNRMVMAMLPTNLNRKQNDKIFIWTYIIYIIMIVRFIILFIHHIVRTALRAFLGDVNGLYRCRI